MYYLHEIINCVQDKVPAYLDFVERKYQPIMDKYEKDWLPFCGLWHPRLIYGRSSEAVLLYRINDLKKFLSPVWRGEAGDREYMEEFHYEALQFRTRWFDKVLVSLPFSPEPPVRPQIERTGAAFLDQRINVRPGSVTAFIAAMQHKVIPAAQKQGLRLELIARALAKPTEFHALWSLPDLPALLEWRNGYDILSEAPRCMEAAWDYVEEFEERDLEPSTTSPLGGITPYVTKQGAGPASRIP